MLGSKKHTIHFDESCLSRDHYEGESQTSDKRDGCCMLEMQRRKLCQDYGCHRKVIATLMLERGFRQSSTGGHVAVMRFLHATLGSDVSGRMIMVMNEMRKKRHMIVYEEMDIVSSDEAERGAGWAEEFVEMINDVIRQTQHRAKL